MLYEYNPGGIAQTVAMPAWQARRMLRLRPRRTSGEPIVGSNEP